MKTARGFRIVVGWILLLVVTFGSKQAEQVLADSPAEPPAHAELSQPIDDEKHPRSEGAVDLNSVDKELFKRLFIKRRKEHLEAVKNLQRMNSYERQYKMINVLAEKMFDVIESKKVLLENFTESELRYISFSSTNETSINIKDALSSVLENIALFGDIVLNLPDITHRMLKTQPKWNSTIRWSFDFLNRTKDWLDKPTLNMINLVLQELNITKRETNYINPNRLANAKSTKQGRSNKGSSKKEKRKKEPTLTRVEL